MENLELPAQMSPCLGIFIALLLDESTSSATGETNGLPLAIAISAKNDSPRDKGEPVCPHIHGRMCSSRVDLLDGRATRVRRVVINAFGGDVLKAR